MRLIDADANIETMKKCAENPENAQALLCYRYAQRILGEAPTVEPASPWHRVEDELPKEKQNKNYKDFEYVLCATTFGDVRPYKFGTPIGWDEPHFWYGADGIMDKYVTHWMPLPEPPKEE